MRINKGNKIILFSLFMQFCIFVSCLFAKEAPDAAVLKRLEAEEYTKEVTISRPEIVYSASNLKDPFINALPVELGLAAKDKTEIKLPVLTIQGIVFGPKFSQVIINNKVLKVGEQISDATVTEINKDEVSVLFNDKIYKLVAPAVVAKTLKIQGGKK